MHPHPSTLTARPPSSGRLRSEARQNVDHDHEFIALQTAYRPTGGLARRGDLAERLQRRHGGSAPSLDEFIAGGQVFGFDWHHGHWIPMFQFEPASLTLRSDSPRVLAELAPVLDGRELALWFVLPNGWLNDRRPVDLLASHLPDVLDAARADRYVCTGF